MISVPDAGLLPRTPAARLVHERVDDLVREAVRVRRERGRRDHAHHLPVTRRRVLALRALDEPAGDRRRAGLRRAAFERHDVSEPERLEIGQVEASDRAGHVAESVGAFVPVLRRVRQLTSADGIEHDHARPRHGGYSTAALDDVLGLLLLVRLHLGHRRPRRGDHVRRHQDLPDGADPEETVRHGPARVGSRRGERWRSPLPAGEARSDLAARRRGLRRAACTACRAPRSRPRT